MSNIKQVIVMRTDLQMRKGKMIAQGAHASIAFMTQALSYKFAKSEEFGDYILATTALSEVQKQWIDGRFTKICVRVDSEQELVEVHERALEAGLTSYMIEDAGLTEFAGVKTKTCCAIGPDEAEKIDKITGHLKLL